MDVVAIIQARMGSTRLPGKVLADLAGQPMLVRVADRVARSREIHSVAVATSGNPRDDPIRSLCAERGLEVFSGSEDDVLDRYYRAARHLEAQAVVRVTSDCPLIDPSVVDVVVRAFREGQPDLHYATNVWPKRTYPRGLDVEVMRFDALARAWQADAAPACREHVTPWLQRHPEAFRTLCVENDEDLSALRWTVDTADDLRFARTIYDHFGDDRFTWQDVLAVLADHPEWTDINRHVTQKEI